LTRATDISIRQLLSMTSGYQDYWPQDYVFMDMQRPAPAREIMQRWAEKALDFEPGTKWQYSNTNYVIAASIVERAAGVPFMQFLQQRIFTPLKMTSVADFNTGPLGPNDAQPLLRHGLGPFRAAPKEGRGMVVWRRPARHDRPRPGVVEYLDHESIVVEAGLVQDPADRCVARGR
jgi:CubicO group peptidase (beta-lactamase class C family)